VRVHGIRWSGKLLTPWTGPENSVQAVEYVLRAFRLSCLPIPSREVGHFPWPQEAMLRAENNVEHATSRGRFSNLLHLRRLSATAAGLLPLRQVRPPLPPVCVCRARVTKYDSSRAIRLSVCVVPSTALRQGLYVSVVTSASLRLHLFFPTASFRLHLSCRFVLSLIRAHRLDACCCCELCILRLQPARIDYSRMALFWMRTVRVGAPIG